MDDLPWAPDVSSTYDNASWISKLFFDWTRKLVWKIWRSPTNCEKIIEDVPNSLKSDKIYQNILAIDGKNMFTIVLKKSWKRWMAISLLSFIRYCLLPLTQAYFMGKLIASFSALNVSSDVLLHERYIPAAVILFIAIPIGFVQPHLHFNIDSETAKVRILCYSLIYNKLLRIRSGDMHRINIGQIINMFASDVSKFEESLRLMLFRLYDVITIPACLAFLQLNCGLPGTNGALLLILLGISGPFATQQLKKLGLKKAVLIDRRLKLTTDMISEAKTMKMFCWEDAYIQSIEEIRKKEKRIILQTNYFNVVTMVLNNVANHLAIVTVVLTMLYFNHQISARVIYTSFAVYNTISWIFIKGYSNLIPLTANAYVSFQRLQKILNIEDITEAKSKPYSSISLANVTSSWQPSINLIDETKFCLRSINAVFLRSAISAITGAVGSGKSMLLLTIANELFIHSGKVKRGGSMTYMPQEPWLFPSTVKQNILFGLPFDEHRYAKVTYSCALIRDFCQFPNGDQAIIDDKGLKLSGGQKARICLARTMYRQSDIYLLDDPLSAVDVNVGKHIWDNCLKVCGRTVLLVTHNFHVLNQCDAIIQLEKGCTVDRDVQQLKIEMKKDNRDHTVDNSIETAEDRKNVENRVTHPTTEEIKKVEVKRSSVLLWCRMGWRLANGYGLLSVIITLSLIQQVLKTLFDIFLSKWIYAETHTVVHALAYYRPWSLSLNILCIFVGFEILLTFVNVLFCVHICVSIAEKFHQNMLKSITRAKMRFFDSHQTGQIMSRFSKDIQFVDDLFLYYLDSLTRFTLMLLGMIINASYSNVISIGPLFLVFLSIVAVFCIYFKVVNHIKQMEASARSPVYSFLTCTLGGVPVVRSHQVQSIVIKEFNNRQDKHSAFWFRLKGVNFWLGLQCEIVGLLQSYIVVICTLVLPNFTNSSRLGVGISSTVSFGACLSFFIREFTEADNMLVSIERIQEYIDLPAEEGYERSQQPIPSNWPEFGHLVFRRINIFYGDFQALKNISFDILPNEKIGIVGRTGAGKSSIISALFRLTETDGEIEIDGINIKTLPLIEYRKKISIIPQNPVILSGSIRHNLDTMDEFSDEQLWDALECVHLKDEVMRKEKKLEDGMNEFSCGQKQLFCLARTLLHKNKILILDEATSNVDNDTDAIIQQLIRTKFRDSTILVIAHRLQTVMDLDRIMMIENGEIIEFDSPRVLLNTNSVFKRLVEKNH